ncbi:MAG: hypothetical protein H5T99_14395, partial [Moorella sp. (in: Bacteria)]|nr:hypothetical protein [Moorella sp. (in: firmicutes)]
SIALELATDTRPVVEAVRANPGLSLEELLRCLGESWPGAIRHLFVLCYLVNEGEVRLFTHPDDGGRFSEGTGSSAGPQPGAGFRKRESGPGEAGRFASWRLGYPDNQVRYVKGTAALGRHLERSKL